MNASKTKVMKIKLTDHPDLLDSIIVNGEAIENIIEFVYLGAKITAAYDDSGEIRRRLNIVKNVTILSTGTWKDSHVSLSAKERLFTSLVFSITTYGSECWVLKKKDIERIVSLEKWCYRRSLKVSWTEEKTNEWVIREIKCKTSL